MIPTTSSPARSAFTLVELLVVISIIGLLIALTLPALQRARTGGLIMQTGNNLRSLGQATHTYLHQWDNHLPQVAWDVGGGQMAIIGALFGGKLGTLPAFGIDQVGADERPLNKHLGERWDREEEVPYFESPLDVGGDVPGLGRVANMYDLIGTSYTLNDHALDGEAFATLVPRQSPDGRPGGRMPRIQDESKTWIIGEHPIYNYQEDGDRRHRWYNGEVKTSLWFLDGHIKTAVTVPPGIVNTTKDYTFLPSEDWFDPP